MKRPTYVTFDCYDTLVEFPIDRVTRQILGPRLAGIDVDAFLAAFEALRYRTTTFGPYRPYRAVLRDTLAQAMQRFGFPYRDEDGAALVAAVPAFGPFPDVPPALERLRRLGEGRGRLGDGGARHQKRSATPASSSGWRR